MDWMLFLFALGSSFAYSNGWYNIFCFWFGIEWIEILYKRSLFTEFHRYNIRTSIVNSKKKERSPVQVFIWRAPQSHQSAAIKPLNPHFQSLTLFFFIFFQFSAPKNSLKPQKCLKESWNNYNRSWRTWMEEPSLDWNHSTYPSSDPCMPEGSITHFFMLLLSSGIPKITFSDST